MGKIMNYNKRKFKRYIFWGIIFPIIGIALIVLPMLLPDVFQDKIWHDVMLYGGCALAFVGVLFLLAAAAEVYKARVSAAKAKQQKKAPAPQPAPKPEPKPEPKPVPAPVPAPVPEPIPEPEPEPTPPLPEEQNVQYFPSENAYDLVNLGPRQSIEEKFNEIAKMEQAQFVVYIAKLFSIKGYSVKYTPVIDNYNIDLIVEKMGVSIAVGCILTNKILGEGDIRSVADGRRHYQVNNVMALTNMYFDRTALNFAKQEKMSLIDRNILAEDFM